MDKRHQTPVCVAVAFHLDLPYARSARITSSIGGGVDFTLHGGLIHTVLVSITPSRNPERFLREAFREACLEFWYHLVTTTAVWRTRKKLRRENQALEYAARLMLQFGDAYLPALVSYRLRAVPEAMIAETHRSIITPIIAKRDRLLSIQYTTALHIGSMAQAR